MTQQIGIEFAGKFISVLLSNPLHVENVMNRETCANIGNKIIKGGKKIMEKLCELGLAEFDVSLDNIYVQPSLQKSILISINAKSYIHNQIPMDLDDNSLFSTKYNINIVILIYPNSSNNYNKSDYIIKNLIIRANK